MFQFIKSIFKTKNYFGKTYKRPLLFAFSNLAGFNELIGKFPDLIRTVHEDRIPAGVDYFFYIGNGEFIKKIKVDLSNHNYSNLSKMDDETEQRIFDFTNGVGADSPTYREFDILTLVFNERDKGLPGNLLSKD